MVSALAFIVREPTEAILAQWGSSSQRIRPARLSSSPTTVKTLWVRAMLCLASKASPPARPPSEFAHIEQLD